MYYKATVITLTTFLASYALANKCDICDRFQCPHVDFCPSGVTQDACRCCEICAQRLGEKCDLGSSENYVNGTCGDYLKCSTEAACVCVEEEPVCGSDGVTYSSICVLLEETTNNRELTLDERTPCSTGPKMKTSPKDSARPAGSILILDCEATGFPVPKISWELYRDDGSTVQLPGDDPLVAIQIRGGPEKQMVTGWVQIMKIVPRNVGIYSCIATNENGEARATAKVSLIEGDATENEI